MGCKRVIVKEGITGKCKHYTYAHVLIGEQYPFYVGIGTKTKKGKFVRARTSSKHNNYWNCYTKNKDYLVFICSESDDYELIKQQEIEYISILGKKIDDKENYLVNITNGGEGTKGLKFSKERIEALSKKYSGSGNPMFGKRSANARKINKLDLNGDIVESFESIKDAALNIKITPQAMSESIKYNYTSKGYKWVYGK